MVKTGRLRISSSVVTGVRRLFAFFSSLKTAIPLLVITIAVTIGGSFLPTPDFFRTWWYLTLLGLNGVSLLFITILHIPLILERKGRNALIGVVCTHLGILILIVGAIYGLSSSLRFDVKAIEGVMTIVHNLPFVIRLDQLLVEDYAPGEVVTLDPEFVPKKRQESHLSFFKNGQLITTAIAGPGKPTKVETFTILPAFKDIGWCFELIITDPLQRMKTFTVKPWASPIFQIGDTQLMAHSPIGDEVSKVQIFTKVDDRIELLGVVGAGQDLLIENYSVSLGSVKRYTGLSIYNRPHAPLLVAGCVFMLFGLVWHFYFRYRDRKTKNEL